MSNNVIQFTVKAVDNFSSTMGGINGIVKKAGLAFTVAAGAAGVAANALIQVGKENENLRIRMNAMLGSVEEGNRLFQEMATFAAEVPFAYDEIMSSATQLSGIMEGGVDEIGEWMPMIADLATVSGLSIEKTTEQITRMYSAGAGAADLFRERGITAMLGFEAGVAISAEDTREKLVAAFNDSESKFRGASEKMASTWDGIMSMIGDKWREIKVQIAESGLFEYFKAIAMVIDDQMAAALEEAKVSGVDWANSSIDGIRSIFEAVGFLADMFRGLEVVWAGLEVVFAKVAEKILGALDIMVNGIVRLRNMIPGIVAIKEPFEGIALTAELARERTDELATSFNNLAAEEMPSDAIENFALAVEEKYARITEAAQSSHDTRVELEQQASALALFNMDNEVNKTIESNQKKLDALITYTENYSAIFDQTMASIFNNAQTLGEEVSGIIEGAYNTLTEGIGDAIAAAIVDGDNLGEAMRNVFKQVVKQVISGLITMGIQRAIMTGIFGAASATESAAALSSNFAATYSGAFAATAAIPIIGPALAPGVASGSLAAVTAGTLGAKAAGAGMGIAHGGLTNVPKEQTYLLDKGERVFSPNQNSDFTNFINGGGAGGSQINVESVEIHILENATNAESLLNMSDEDWEEIVARPIIDSLNALNHKGITPDSAERIS